ncbi:ROK family protein [Candidatus Woesearchaeota archaeon]|nr:ROK family protein [Candidatus Woesearchaeota archaeon]
MKYAIGLDIGGTKIEGCLVSETGKIIDRIRFPAEAKKGKAQVLKNICDVIDYLKKENKGKRVSGIGAGIPGFCDRKGVIIHMPNAPLKGMNLSMYLNKKFGCPVSIDNDANCFALAENMFGAGKGSSTCVGVIFGTGVGAGIVVDGRTFKGCCGGAGEIGHNMVTDKGRLQIGKNNYESYCGAPYIIKRYKATGGKIQDPDTKKIFSSKEPKAQMIVRQTHEYAARLLGSVVNTLNPDCIVLGGGVSNALSPALLQEEIKKYAIPFSASKVRVRRHKLGDSSGVLGAAALVFNR